MSDTPVWLDEFPNLKAVYEQWMARELVPIDVFNAMTGEMKAKAFSAVVTMTDNQRQMLLDGIGKAITEGLTVADFRASMGTLLESPAYADLVYRVNVGNAQLGGIYGEMFGPGGDASPYWQFLAVIDSRNDEESECPQLICRALDGKIFHKSDPIGWRLLPPNHFQDRCNVRELRTEEAKSHGVQNGFHLRAEDPWDFDKRSLAGVSF